MTTTARVPFTRASILAQLREQLALGRPIIGAGDDGTSHALIVARTRTPATCRELPVPWAGRASE